MQAYAIPPSTIYAEMEHGITRKEHGTSREKARRVPFGEMTVKELIESNQCIGDINIIIRDRNGMRTKGYHIGADEGMEPIRRSLINEKDVYRKVNINAFDTKDIYQLYSNRIPKQLLELEVFSWKSTKAYRRGMTHSLECIDIEIRNGAALELTREDKIKDEQLAGQMSLEF